MRTEAQRGRETGGHWEREILIQEGSDHLTPGPKCSRAHPFWPASKPRLGGAGTPAQGRCRVPLPLWRLPLTRPLWSHSESPRQTALSSSGGVWHRREPSRDRCPRDLLGTSSGWGQMTLTRWGLPSPLGLTSESHTAPGPPSDAPGRSPHGLCGRSRSPDSPASLKPTGYGPVTPLVWGEPPGQGPFPPPLGCSAPQM